MTFQRSPWARIAGESWRGVDYRSEVALLRGTVKERVVEWEKNTEQSRIAPIDLGKC